MNGITYFNKKPTLLFIIIFAGMIWTGQYALRHLWNPDEARYTYVAQEMNDTGNWLVPQRNGKFYSHKPPLMFWLIKLGTFVTNGKFNGISGRLPSLLGGILAMWALVMIACKWFDSRTAWWSLLIVSTSYLFWFKGGTGQIDMLLLGLEMIALYLLYEIDENPAIWRSVLAFSFMGLAVLAKGPVGFIVPSGIYIFSNLVSGNKKYILRWHWVWGTVLCLLWPAAWLVLAKIHHAPDAYFDQVLFAQNIGRFEGKFGGHYHPFYYYLQYLIIDFLPWIVFIPLSIAVLIKEKTHIKQLKMIGGWIFFVVFFFSVCKGKRNLYILSVYPAAGMIIAAAISRMNFMPHKWTFNTALSLIILMGLVSIVLIAGPLIYKIPGGIELSSVPPDFIFWLLGLIFFTGTVLLIKIYRRTALSEQFFITAVFVFIIAELYIGMVIFPAFNPIKTPVRLASVVQKLLPENQRLLLYDMNGELLAYYSHRRGKRIDDPGSLLKEMKKTKKGIVVFKQKVWQKMPVIFHSFGKVHNFRVGNGRMCWLEYGYSSEKNYQRD